MEKAGTALKRREVPSGDALRAARLAAGVTIAEAARWADVDRSTWQRLEAGGGCKTLAVAKSVTRTYHRMLKAVA